MLFHARLPQIKAHGTFPEKTQNTLNYLPLASSQTARAKNTNLKKQQLKSHFFATLSFHEHSVGTVYTAVLALILYNNSAIFIINEF